MIYKDATNRICVRSQQVSILGFSGGVKHRLENPGKTDLELIEVQSGSYLGEDDIVRFEDAYVRG